MSEALPCRPAHFLNEPMLLMDAPYRPYRPLDSVADELLSEILFLTVYTGDEFSSDLDYQWGRSSYGPHSDFAKYTLLVDKRFHRLGVEVLWRNVVVRNTTALDQVVALAHSLGAHTRRFELRLTGTYNSELLPAALVHMPRLTTFLVRNYPSAQGHYYHVPHDTVDALCDHCPDLLRIEFQSSLEEPTDLHLLRILNVHRRLVSLSVERLCPTPSVPTAGWTQDNSIRSGSNLRVLSIGCNRHTFPSMFSAQAQESFLDMLTVSGALTSLVDLRMMEFSPRVVAFLERYGHQLRRMVFALAQHHSDQLHDPDLFKFCPHLEEVVWIAKDVHAIDMDRCIPAGHPSVRSANIVCGSMDVGIPHRFVARLQRLLNMVRDGDFPLLAELRVQLGGEVVPDIECASWFRTLKRRLRAKNSGVVVIVD